MFIYTALFFIRLYKVKSAAEPKIFRHLFGNNSVIAGVRLKRILFHLNADIADRGIVSRKELSFGSRRDSEPVACLQLYGLAVYYGFSGTRKDPVDLLILLMVMRKWNARARGQIIYADLRARQSQLVMQLRSGAL